MILDPAWFHDYPDLSVGDRVSFTSVSRVGADVERVSGVGTVTLIWYGIEEMCDVEVGSRKRTLCRALGDTVEKV